MKGKEGKYATCNYKNISKNRRTKKRLAKAITDSIVEITGNEEKAISITFEEVTPEEWPEKVYRPDILEKQNMLYKKPGYNPFSK